MDSFIADISSVIVEEGDEVLLPSLTFVATGNAVSHLKAIPHFVDVESRIAVKTKVKPCFYMQGQNSRNN